MEVYHIYLTDTGETLSVTDNLVTATDYYISRLYTTLDVWYNGRKVGSLSRGKFTKTQFAKEIDITTQLEKHIEKNLIR